MKKRNGFAVLEMLAALTLLSVLLTSGLLMLKNTYTWNQVDVNRLNATIISDNQLNFIGKFRTESYRIDINNSNGSYVEYNIDNCAGFYTFNEDICSELFDLEYGEHPPVGITIYVYLYTSDARDVLVNDLGSPVGNHVYDISVEDSNSVGVFIVNNYWINKNYYLNGVVYAN